MKSPVDGVDSAFGCHCESAPGGATESRKEPSEEVHGGDSHSHTEQHTGHDAFRAALTKSEGEARDYNRDERKTAGDGRRKRGHQNVDGVLPG